MIPKFAFAGLLIAVLVLGTGCGNVNPGLIQSDNGGQIDVNVGDQFSVTLPSNPSTGYNWEPQALDLSMLEQVGESKYESVGEPMPGSGGNLTLTFKALNAGSTTLVLVYHRSWEADVDPIDTFIVTVNVK